MVKVSRIDVLAIGAHPDDVEVGAGGLVCKLIKDGLKAGIVDLTAGEMASNGTPEERHQEAQKAALQMGLAWRRCLGIPDRGIKVNAENIQLLAEVIREVKPTLILCPHWEDRHPDHVMVSKLVQEAYFNSGLTRVESNFLPHRPAHLWYYFLSQAVEPKFIVDVSDVYDKKKLAIAAHETQFGKLPGSTDTFLNSGPGSLSALIESRDRYFGSLIGCMYGEGFTLSIPLAINNPLNLLEVQE